MSCRFAIIEGAEAADALLELLKHGMDVSRHQLQLPRYC